MSCYNNDQIDTSIIEDLDSEISSLNSFRVLDDGKDDNTENGLMTSSKFGVLPQNSNYPLNGDSSKLVHDDSVFSNKKIRISRESNRMFIQNILNSHESRVVIDKRCDFNKENTDIYLYDNYSYVSCKEANKYTDRVDEPCLVESITSSDVDLDLCLNNENNFNQVSNFPCFSTGSGKKITIDEQSIHRAKKALGEEFGPGGDNSISGNPECPAFSTGSGKKITIDEQSIYRAKKALGEEFGPGGDNSISGNSECPAFSTGSGKKITIDEQSIHRAKKALGEELDNVSASNLSTREECTHKIHTHVANNKLIDKNVSNKVSNIKSEPQRKNKMLKKEELVIPDFFQDYSETTYIETVINKHSISSNSIISPTFILIEQSVEILEKYVFILKKGVDEYNTINYEYIYSEIECFLNKYPIYPKGMYEHKLRWFQIQYLLVLHDECLKWARQVKRKLKQVNTNATNKKELMTQILISVRYPSIRRIMNRICKRAITEFFDAKRSPLVKICEGDFTISVPLNLRVLSHREKDFVDEMGEQHKRKILTCTDGWYIINIHTVFPNITSNVELYTPRNVFVSGGNWLSTSIELGHPLEIEASTLEYPNLLYGFNMLRPILSLKKSKLGFHFNPILFRLKNLVSTSTINSREISSKNNNALDCGGGLAFLIQIVVIHVFPICFRELITETNNNDSIGDSDSGNREGVYYVTRDENEMDVSLDTEMNKIFERNLKQQKSLTNGNGNNADYCNNSYECSQGETTNDIPVRRISIDSKMLVLDYWKYKELEGRNVGEEISLLDLISNCSILTLPSGIDIDDLTAIKPGTVIRLSWMKVFKTINKLNIGLNKVYSYSRLVPTKKTSLNLKKRIKDSSILDSVIDAIEKPVLVHSSNVQDISVLKGGWPLNVVGLLLQIQPIEERKRGFEHCFEFKILLISSLGCKIFIRVHTTGSHESELRMCERVNNKLNKAMPSNVQSDYRKHIILVENTDFNYYERSTGLFHFNAKIPYSIFNIPYSSGIEYFSNSETQKSLLREIQHLSFCTNCDLPVLFS